MEIIPGDCLFVQPIPLSLLRREDGWIALDEGLGLGEQILNGGQPQAGSPSLLAVTIHFPSGLKRQS